MTIVKKPDGTVTGRNLGEAELNKLIEKNQPAK